MTAYPAEWETDVLLSDGTTAALRPIRPEDRDLLDAFHKRQSRQSIYFRYFRYRPELSDQELEYFTNVDYDERMAFVAMQGDDIVAVARYETWDAPTHPGENRAEVAFFVDDAHHGKGLGTLMLEYLAAAARRSGLDGFTATVLPENYDMLRVFRRAGFDVTTRYNDGIIDVGLGIALTGHAERAIASRSRRAQARSVARLLEPRSVAVIGASRHEGAVGRELLRSLVDGSFAGPIHAVNRAAAGSEIDGRSVVASVDDLDDELDLAIVAVPAAEVEAVVESCAAKGVHGLLVVSTGFRDAGHEGTTREGDVVRLARANGMRLIGPGSFGIVNTAEDVSLRALFLPVDVHPGPVGLLSESGPLGAALLEQAGRAGLGISSFIALGNRADVSVNDALQYWADDDRTSVIALYVENYGNIRNLVPIARSVCVDKPVLTVAPADPELAALLRQSGVMLVDRVAELVDHAAALSHQPIPTGDRVAVIGNSGSVARLAAAACRRVGLEVVAPKSAQHATAADVVLLGDADTLSLRPNAGLDDYEQTIVAAAVTDEVDSVVVAVVPTLELPADRLGPLLDRIDRAIAKPMVAAGLIDPEQLGRLRLPAFTFPEDAAEVLGRMAELGRWRRKPRGPEIEPVGPWESNAATAVANALGSAQHLALDLTDERLPALLASLDLPVSAYRVVGSASEAVAAAEGQLGYPVVLKAGRLAVRAPGETGGAALDLATADQLMAAFDRMRDRFGDSLLPAIVQASTPTGFHLRLELTQDRRTGSWLSMGIGGGAAVAAPSVERLVLPASEAELDQLLSTPWFAAAVPDTGARFAVRDLASRLAIVAAVPDVAAVRLDPVLVSERDAVPIGVEVTLRPWPAGPLDDVRHL